MEVLRADKPVGFKPTFMNWGRTLVRYDGDKKMELSQILSWVGTGTGMLIGIPQLIKTIQTKQAGDLSATTFVLILITCSLFLIRMIVIHETAMIFYYTFLVIINSLQLFLIWKYNRSIQKRSLWNDMVITCLPTVRGNSWTNTIKWFKSFMGGVVSDTAHLRNLLKLPKNVNPWIYFQYSSLDKVHIKRTAIKSNKQTSDFL